MTRAVVPWVLGAALAMLALCSPVLAAERAAPSAPEFSRAETVLWMTDQLKAVDVPMLIRYRFSKTGSLEEGFEDTVEFRVSKIHDDGMKSADLKFFSGERNFPVPPVERTDVNPVLKVFFQGDVYEMNRLTDVEGSARERWRYFQRRIKFALAQTAVAEEVRFNFDGREYQGIKISFTPYRNDPKRAHFEKFAEKRYEVIISDALPGYVYQIQTTVPDGATADNVPPLIQETLRLHAVERLASGADF